MLVFLQKHEFDWQIPSQIVFSDDHMKTSPGHCGHFGHRDAWFQWDKSMISAKRVLWKIFECRVCQFSRPPRLWIDTRPSRMAIYVQMAIPNSISHTNSIRKRIPDRFSDFSVIAISLQYWSCLPYLIIFPGHPGLLPGFLRISRGGIDLAKFQIGLELINGQILDLCRDILPSPRPPRGSETLQGCKVVLVVFKRPS